MKRTTRLVIFDLDGTLLDTVEDLAVASNEVLQRRGYPVHPVADYKHFVGEGLQVLMERITPQGTSQEEVRNCCGLFEEIYRDCWHTHTRPYGGIEDMLRELQGQGLPLCVLSNKMHTFTTLCAKHFFAPDTFELVYGLRSGVPKKPNPQGALEIAEKMGVAPADCLYIGDTAIDMQTGKSAGMFTIGVLWGFRDAKELRLHNADLLVASPEEIVTYVVSAS